MHAFNFKYYNKFGQILVNVTNIIGNTGDFFFQAWPCTIVTVSEHATQPMLTFELTCGNIASNETF